MKDIDFKRAIVHDSARESFRNPLGAVGTGSTVTLKISIREFSFDKACLAVLRDNAFKEIEMRREGDDYVIEYDVRDEPCVLWYWFVIHLSGDQKLYYGARAGGTSGVGTVYWSLPPAFQLTVYDNAFLTPHWFKNAIMYQIFPDRFHCGNTEGVKKGLQYHHNLGRTDMELHKTWEEMPVYVPVNGNADYQPCDLFGGDLAGIEQQLLYLRELGTTLLYLNPVFEADSNHRYNTADYLKIDPVLGTNEDFEQLADRAETHGIKIMLDGVFSHTGDDSVYFNRYGRYDTVGAYQSKDSPYYSWFQFDEYPDKYKSWWGFESLPEVNEEQPEWIDFVIEGADSVFNTWLDKGAAGYRLDVADELPDDTIERMRAVLKHNSQDHVLLGEVWEDATTKQSYGVNRRYALGRGLDSVMNYPFTNATIDFLLGRIDAYKYRRFFVNQSQNYPREMYYALMNLLSSHDIARIRTVLGTGVDARSMTREQQAHFVITDEQDAAGARLQKVAAGIQFSLPGVPCVYYGDEVGMNGLLDPFNRQTYRVEDEDMLAFYKEIGKIRSDHIALRTGNAVFYAHNKDVIGILRFCVEGEDAMGNIANDEILLTVANRSGYDQKIVLDLLELEECMTAKQIAFFRDVELREAASLLNGQAFRINEGLLEVDVKEKSVDIVEIIWE